MKLVLDRWQGLGDNLQVSTLPRRFYELYGEKCVWISNANPYRSPEIKKLVWENNPYVAGFTDEPGLNLTGHLQFGVYNWIELWERVYSLPGPYSKQPEIYCPTLDKDIFNATNYIVIDISYSVDSYNQNIKPRPERIGIVNSTVRELISQSNCKVIQIRNRQLKDTKEFVSFLSKDIITETVEVSNIEEYANIIKWAKQFICTHTGCHPLAAALRKDTICFIPENYVSMKYFTFDNVRYIPI